MADSLGRDDSSVRDPTEEAPSALTRLYRGEVDSVATRREGPDGTTNRTEVSDAAASTRGPDAPSPTATYRVVENRRDRRGDARRTDAT